MISQQNIEQLHRYLDLLGLGTDASFDDVRSAYRRLALTSHPDRFDADPRRRAEAEEEMKRINAAYTWLREHRWMLGIDWTTERVDEEERRKQQQERTTAEGASPYADDRTGATPTPDREPGERPGWYIYLIVLFLFNGIRMAVPEFDKPAPQQVMESFQSRSEYSVPFRSGHADSAFGDSLSSIYDTIRSRTE